jgi:hypothetical protein
MIRGQCLCGAVRFELDRVVGPFELCHCSRCGKVCGSAFMATVGVRRTDFRWVCGRELINTYEAPLLEAPPAYRVCFCTVCGSCVPDPADESDSFEIAAGSLDDAPCLEPDRHIFVELKAAWFKITDDLPQLDKNALLKHRQKTGPSDRIKPTPS